MKVLLDQGLPRSAAERLRSRGIDAIHTGEVGLASAHDRAIIEWSDREGRAIVTLDADFHAILAISGRNQPSVVRIRIEGLDAGATADLIVAVLAQAKAELASGAVVTVSEDRFRIRRLPLPGVRGR